jgi:hypothetical protein
MVSAQSAAKQHATMVGCLLAQPDLPGTRVVKVDILLPDSTSDRLSNRFRRDIEVWAGDEAEFFENLREEIVERSQKLGGRECLRWMELTLSHAGPVSARVGILVDSYQASGSAPVRRVYSPQGAAILHPSPPIQLGLRRKQVCGTNAGGPESWVEVWPQIRLTVDMFVPQLKGHLKEPAIPDGSLCAIRRNVTDSPDGKIVVGQPWGEAESNRCAIKRNRISQNADLDTEGDEAWFHERFTLESKNPDYKAGDVAPAGMVRRLGEFLFIVIVKSCEEATRPLRNRWLPREFSVVTSETLGRRGSEPP